MEKIDCVTEEKIFLSKMKNIIQNVLETDKLETGITMDTLIVHGTGENSFDLSSIDYVDLMVLFEREFDIELDFTVQFYSVKDMYQYLKTVTGAE